MLISMFLRRVLTGKQSRANVVNISMVDSSRILYSYGISSMIINFG